MMPFLTVSSSPTLEKDGRARDRPRNQGIPWTGGLFHQIPRTGGLSLSNPWTGGLSAVYTGFSSHISTHLPPDRTPSSTLSPCLATQTPKHPNPWTGGLSPSAFPYPPSKTHGPGDFLPLFPPVPHPVPAPLTLSHTHTHLSTSSIPSPNPSPSTHTIYTHTQGHTARFAVLTRANFDGSSPKIPLLPYKKWFFLRFCSIFITTESAAVLN